MGALAPKVRAAEPEPDEAKGLGNAPTAVAEAVDANGAGATTAGAAGGAEEPKVNVGAAAAGGAAEEPAGPAVAAAAVVGPLLTGAVLPNENPLSPAAPPTPDGAEAVVVDDAAAVVPKANPAPTAGAGAPDAADAPGAEAVDSVAAPDEVSAARCENAMPKGIEEVDPPGVPLLRGGLPALDGDLAGGSENDSTEASAAAEVVAATSFVAVVPAFALSTAIVGTAAGAVLPKEKPVTGTCGAAAGAPPKEKLTAAGGPAGSFLASASEAVDFSVDGWSCADVVLLLVVGFSVARGSPKEIDGGLVSPATVEGKENDGAPLVADEVARGPATEDSPTVVAGVFPVIGVATATRRRFVVVSVSQEFNDSALTSSSRCSFRKTRKNTFASRLCITAED